MDETLIISRFERLEKDVEKLKDANSQDSLKLVRIEEQLKTLTEKFERLEAQITQLLQQPQKRWDLVTASVVTAAISAVVAFFAGKLL